MLSLPLSLPQEYQDVNVFTAEPVIALRIFDWYLCVMTMLVAQVVTPNRLYYRVLLQNFVVNAKFRIFI